MYAYNRAVSGCQEPVSQRTMLVLFNISWENGASQLFPRGRKGTVTGESPLQAGRGNNNMDVKKLIKLNNV